MSTIAVVGTGYVGLTTGTCFAHMGHTVRCLDIDSEKILGLREGRLPIFEPGLDVLVAENQAKGRLTFTTSFLDGLRNAEFVFIAVGTPPMGDSQAVDMRFVYQAAETIARSLESPAIIVNKSTSPIGTVGKIANIMSSVRPDFGPWRVVSNPEFLREGRAIEDCLNPSRVVLGADHELAARRVAALYDSLNCPVITTDPNSAEMIKYASNAFLATKISFINEVARVCHALGADVCTVAEGMGYDSRIGAQFLAAGLGYGGSCFPKDVSALTHMAADAGLHPQLLKAVVDINFDQRRWVVDLLERELGGLEGKTIAVWGIAFKPETDDIRESPAIDLMNRLHNLGATVRCYDPVATAGQMPAERFPSAVEAARGAHAIVLATEWQEFQDSDWTEIRVQMEGDLVLDGRNCLSPEIIRASGLRHLGIGRGTTPRITVEPVTV